MWSMMTDLKYEPQLLKTDSGFLRGIEYRRSAKTHRISSNMAIRMSRRVQEEGKKANTV